MTIISRLKSWFSALMDGFTYPARAVALLYRNPPLRSYVVIPLLVNIAIGIVLYAGLVYAGLQWTESLMAHMPAWLSIFGIFIQGVLILLLLFVIGFLMLRFGVVLGSPWYSQLSEHIEELQTGNKSSSEPVTWTVVLHEIWLAILFELKKIVLLVIVGTPLLLLELIPVVGTFPGTIGFLALTATIMWLDFLDAPLARRRVPFRRRLALIYRTLPASATFGLVCVGLFWIPLLNLLSMPLCVAGGTLFFCTYLSELEEDDNEATA